MWQIKDLNEHLRCIIKREMNCGHDDELEMAAKLINISVSTLKSRTNSKTYQWRVNDAVKLLGYFGWYEHERAGLIANRIFIDRDGACILYPNEEVLNVDDTWEVLQRFYSTARNVVALAVQWNAERAEEKGEADE